MARGIVVGRLALAVAAAASALLAGCSPQPARVERVEGPPASQGVGGSAYAAPGWKAGDPASWEENLRRRAQAGQDEYRRVQGGS